MQQPVSGIVFGAESHPMGMGLWRWSSAKEEENTRQSSLSPSQPGTASALGSREKPGIGIGSWLGSVISEGFFELRDSGILGKALAQVELLRRESRVHD